MGVMEYAGQRVLFEDRLLAHLQVVIIDKLRRNEPFFMSWLGSLAEGGRAGMWVHPAHPVRFDFVGSRMPVINRDWLHALRQSADSSRGLIVTEENGQVARCGIPPAAERNPRGRAR